MNKEVSNHCVNTANKIVNIVEGMGFTTEKRLATGELNALVFRELRQLVNQVVTDFYNNAGLVPTEPEVVIVDDTESNVDLFAP